MDKATAAMHRHLWVHFVKNPTEIPDQLRPLLNEVLKKLRNDMDRTVQRKALRGLEKFVVFMYSRTNPGGGRPWFEHERLVGELCNLFKKQWSSIQMNAVADVMSNVTKNSGEATPTIRLHKNFTMLMENQTIPDELRLPLKELVEKLKELKDSTLREKVSGRLAKVIEFMKSRSSPGSEEWRPLLEDEDLITELRNLIFELGDDDDINRLAESISKFNRDEVTMGSAGDPRYYFVKLKMLKGQTLSG